MSPRVVLDPVGLFRRVPLQPHQLTEPVTPTADVPVLAHFGVPRVAEAGWSFELTGLVRRPRTYSLDELRGYPRRELMAFHQCVGNPLTPGAPARRISNVVWGGVDLRTLLDEAGVEPGASFLWSYGLDGGRFADVDCEAFVKDVRLSRVDSGDVLVAYELNGEPLTAQHGFPARLVVPGWYGTNSVKWLHRMVLADRRADGPFTTTFYNEPPPPTPEDPSPAPRPVWEIAPESVVVSPAPGARVRAGDEVDVWGWAWAPAGVRTVEVSVGNGWSPATVETREQLAWQRFRMRWRPAAPGEVTVACRAVDNTGVGQPSVTARNQVHSVPVTVTA
ncbi:molybdopterin-dependent oxidoreductase [Pseudonocardia acaciae]|uniref:molybdopterin-dependent oxidoreductase n=1 Tax=Pseudonocardia acaciae TaxID=551276 RepID=UPI0007E8BED4|nr:molybdopterin-dependent oxidoreductase [Pseudonocardia acaciae]